MKRKFVLLFLFCFVISMPSYTFDSIEKQTQDIENRVKQQMQEVEERINQVLGLGFLDTSSLEKDNNVLEAEKILKEGLGDWIWYGRIYDRPSPSGTKYIPLSLKQSQSGARLMVYVFLTPAGKLNLEPRLVFDRKYNIRQENRGQNKIAKIEGRFDRLSVFQENMPYVEDASSKTMYILGREDGYKVGRYERRSIMWMLLESRRFSVQFMSETGSFSSAVFYLNGLEEMILKSIIVLNNQQNYSGNPENMLDQFIDHADRNLI